jgi:Tol biopolymer transport system component
MCSSPRPTSKSRTARESPRHERTDDYTLPFTEIVFGDHHCSSNLKTGGTARADRRASVDRETVRTVIRLCLQTHPKARLHDIADAKLLLGAAPDAAVIGGPAQERRRAGQSPLLWIASLALVAALTGALGYLAGGGGSEKVAIEPSHFAIQLSAPIQLYPETLMVFSPDGRSLVFAASEGGRRGLYRRMLGESNAEAIPGTEEGEGPFFSPDGQWLGFTALGRLMKVPIGGGRPFALSESRGAGGATWMPDNTIVYAPIYSDGLFRMPADGGTSERLTTPDRDDGVLGHWWPQPLPGGKRVVFTAFRTPVDQSRIGVLDLATGKIDWIVDGGFFGRYVPTGHFLYARGQRLFAVAFDPETLERGDAVAVLDDLKVAQTGGFALYDVSSQGNLAYVTESLGNPASQIVWIDRDGTATPAIEEPRRFLTVSLSPDGRQAAVTIQAESRDLWTYSFDRGTLSRLTSGDVTEFDPVWSADGAELFYVVDSPPFELFRIRVGSPDTGERIWSERTELDTTRIAASPLGSDLAYVVHEPETGANLYQRRIDGSEPPRPIRVARSQSENPAVSPDGRWIAYQSSETGRFEIYVERLDGEGRRVQLTSDGGIEPVWAGSGEIFYRRHDEVRVVPTRTGESFGYDPPKTLFSFPIIRSENTQGRVYDVSADGSRVLAVTIPPENRPRQIEIVTNWRDGLERRVSRK